MPKKLVIFDFAGTIDTNQELEGDISDAIKNFSNKYILAIISSTSSSYIKSFLKERNVLSNFSDILGSDLFLSKSDRIKILLEKYNISFENVVYITDTLGDINEDKILRVKSIGVTWGLDDRKTLQKGNPVTIIDDPRDLVMTIDNVLK